MLVTPGIWGQSRLEHLSVASATANKFALPDRLILKDILAFGSLFSSACPYCVLCLRTWPNLRLFLVRFV